MAPTRTTRSQAPALQTPFGVKQAHGPARPETLVTLSHPADGCTIRTIRAPEVAKARKNPCHLVTPSANLCTICTIQPNPKQQCRPKTLVTAEASIFWLLAPVFCSPKNPCHLVTPSANLCTVCTILPNPNRQRCPKTLVALPHRRSFCLLSSVSWLLLPEHPPRRDSRASAPLTATAPPPIIGPVGGI